MRGTIVGAAVRMCLAVLFLVAFVSGPAGVAAAVPTPTIAVDVGSDFVYGNSWPPGATVDIVHSGTLVGEALAVDGFGRFFFSLPTQVIPGDELTVTDGTTTKALVVGTLTVSLSDAGVNIVKGTSDPLATVNVSVLGAIPPSCFLEVTADAAGTWVADFSDLIATGTCSVGSLTSAFAFSVDDDGDRIQRFAQLPVIVAQPAPHDADPSRIYGTDWTEATEVEIAINSILVAPAEAVGSDGVFGFSPVEPIVPGDVITVTGGGYTKSLTVSSFDMISANHAGDAIVGVGTGGAAAWVSVSRSSGFLCGEQFESDGAGDWVVDLSLPDDFGQTCDFDASVIVFAAEEDEDGDRTEDVVHPVEGPLATDDTYSTPADTRLTVGGGGVLVNDVEGGAGASTVWGFDLETDAGGSVDMNEDGSFTYDPPPGFSGSDAFGYVVTDGVAVDVGTVAITVTAPPPPPGSGGGDGVAPPPAPPTGTCPATSSSFQDLDGLSDEARRAIACLVAHQITSGTSDTEFTPGRPVSRWEMALFLARQLRAQGVTLPAATDQGFTDISELPSTAQDAINRLGALGVTKGTGSGTFEPEEPVARWQMALFLARLAGLAGPALQTGSGASFLDLDGLSEEALDAIGRLSATGIARGMSSTAFDPWSEVSRWQMALFLTRMLEADGVILE